MAAIPGRQNVSPKGGRTFSRPMKLWMDSSASQDVRIEIIPLIDVIFCILTFFILAAVGFTRQQVINLDLPQASTATSQMDEMLVITLDDFGQVYVEENRVNTRNDLFQAVRGYVQNNASGLMVLQASSSASYDEVIQVLDVLREVGGDRVALATLPKAPTTPPVTTPEAPQTPTQPNLPTPGATQTPTQPNLPTPGTTQTPTQPPGATQPNIPTNPSPTPTAPE